MATTMIIRTATRLGVNCRGIKQHALAHNMTSLVTSLIAAKMLQAQTQDKISRFHAAHECNGRTDRQTDRREHSLAQACGYITAFLTELMHGGCQCR